MASRDALHAMGSSPKMGLDIYDVFMQEMRVSMLVTEWTKVNERV